ncbi:M23 family metallopeptidase [Collimonas sp. OK412]|jgi:murein DD-endopeptidase MepM/ murein hydrolase activator NlpD|uniref:M23 family metallopeptidase n=1 Tax=Collimonas sp. (strain OK412) TaxID=1801619 RepID=UPI0008E27968|nr:M23 family metallopeptidase [Collimonas sp. OK412]SFD38665.1 Peptidase family M23 [Collimonas sp. OK412]
MKFGSVKNIIFIAAAIVVGGLLLPEKLVMPVQGATSHDWNRKSFWYAPWGVSGVHKGIDIFAPAGKPAVASVTGVVVYSGQFGIGGNVVAILGPKWRIHYYAHLAEKGVTTLSIVNQGDVVGKVGTTGSAAGKPPHLHYAVLSLLPLPWLATSATQGWKRMFFLDPAALLTR